MKFISTLLFASLAIRSANAIYLPATDFGAGCLNFQDDGSWTQVPDFVTNGPALVVPESPFRFSNDTSFPDEAVWVKATGELAASDNDWTLDIFDTSSQNGGTHEAWYKSNDHGTFATTWHSTSATGNEHNTFQIVISEAIGGDMGEGNNVCFCYGDMQWGPGDVRVESSNNTDHTHIDFSGGTYESTADDNSLDHKTCCFHANKLKELGSSADFASLCHARATEAAGANGDPHFKTWQNEHFEYHGQCDLVLTKDADFANGLGIDVHIRTKLVRHWSYIRNAVIRIGNDILEIEGSALEFDSDTHYWINYESQGELTEFAGFPVTMFSQQGTKVTKNRIEIDLDSVYPGQKIVLSTYKEFVKVSFENANEESFGKTVGILGDFKTGKTLARDGVTELDDFTEVGHEWQVLPSDKHLFREVSAPQFPERCIDPEDPRGDRRRLDGSSISEEEAEAACAQLEDKLDRKDCVYDILATQDLDMAGAY